MPELGADLECAIAIQFLRIDIGRDLECEQRAYRLDVATLRRHVERIGVVAHGARIGRHAEAQIVHH